MGYELKKLMNMYGVSTPTMAPAPQMPGAAPKAITELVKPELRAQPVEPVKPTKPSNNAPTAEKEAYQVALTAYNAQKGAYETDLKAWKTESKTYDTALKDYNTALPKYQEDLAKYETDKAAFDETARKYGLDKAQYDQYAQDYQNRLANTNLYNQAQFSTTGANVPAFTTYSDAQKAALGYGPAVTPNVGEPTLGEGEYKLAVMPQPGPQDFTGIGQGGLNQQVQQYMGTNPSMPDLNAYMTRYGLTNYDIRNAMGTGTTYGAPQWTDRLKPPVYGANYDTGTIFDNDAVSGAMDNVLGPEFSDAINNGGTTGTTTGGTTTGGTTGTTTGGTTGTTTTGGTTGTTTGGTTTGGTTGTVYNPYQAYWNDPNWKGSDAYNQWVEWKNSNRARGGYIKNYAQGGAVQGYRRGGPPGTIYGGAGDDMLMGRPAGDMLATAPAPVAEDPQDAMRAMLESYIGEPVDYSSQIAAATERRAAEQKALEELLMGQMNAQDSAPESKAELYLRLAAAFGAPTKTGHFSENLGLVGQTMADELAARSERERAAREKKLGVQTELQKMRLDAAGEEVDTYRGLQESETQYRRDLAKGLMKDYIDSGKPQTEAAKMASDMGLTPGTPEYNEKVREIIALDIAEKKSLIDARLAMRDNVPAAFAALDHQARAAGFLPESEGGDGNYEEFMATRGSGLAAEARVLGTARGEATAAAPVDVATADKTLEYIEEIRTHPGKSIGTGASSVFNSVPGTPGFGFQKRVNQLTSGAFLTAIEQLRGMGALSNAEGQTAKDAVTRMDTATSEEEFDAALSDYENVVKDAQDRARARLQEPTAGAPADGAMPSDEDLLNMYGN